MVLTLVLKAATDRIDVIFLVPFPSSGNFVLCPRGEVTASHWPVPSPALPPGVHSEHYPHGLPIRSISANRFRTKDLGIKISRAHRGKPGHRLADLPAMHGEDENMPGAGLRERLSCAPSAYSGQLQNPQCGLPGACSELAMVPHFGPWFCLSSLRSG